MTLAAGGRNQVYDITMQRIPYPVRGVSPSLGSSWNPTGTAISMSFALPMDTGSVGDALSITPNLAGTLVWTSDFTQVTLRPAAALRTATTYAVELDSTAQTKDGVAIEFPLAYIFSVEPLRISGSSPATGTEDVPLTQQAYFYFNGPCNNDSVEAAVSVSPSTGLAFSWSDRYLYVNPSGGYWKAGTQYRIIVRTRARDAWGNALAAPCTTTFGTRPLRVTSLSPYPGQSGVSLSASISVSFLAAMNKRLTEQAFSCTDASSDQVAGTFSWSSNGTLLYFTPQVPYLPGHDYTVNLDSTATDRFGGSIAPVSFGFTADHFGVSGSYPSPEGSNWAPTQSPYLYFNTSADAAACEAAFSIEPAIELDYSWSNNYLYYKPRGNYWRSSTRYLITLAATAGDIWGGTMNRPYTTSFYTRDARVTSVSPVFETAGVSVNTSVSIGFNTAMDPAAVAAALTLETGDGTPVAGTVSGAQTSYSFSPAAPLDPQTVYVVRVGTDAADMFGEPMLAEWTSTFTTGN